MDKSSCYYCKQSRRSRRDFLRLGTLGVLGVNLADFLRFDSMRALAATAPPTKAKAVILLWLEGGISHLDSWDVKGNSRFRPISTNAPGVQIAEVFPSIARHMDKLSIIRSMQTQERNHPQATIETLTGHRPSPALKFPSVGSIVARELGTQNDMPPFADARPRGSTHKPGTSRHAGWRWPGAPMRRSRRAPRSPRVPPPLCVNCGIR